jgi:hypothetical protein
MKKFLFTFTLTIVFLFGSVLVFDAMAINNQTRIELPSDDNKKDEKKSKKKSNITVQEVPAGFDDQNNEKETRSGDLNEQYHERAVIEGDCTKEGFDRE